MLSRGTFQTLNNNTTKPQGKTLDVNSTNTKRNGRQLHRSIDRHEWQI